MLGNLLCQFGPARATHTPSMFGYRKHHHSIYFVSVKIVSVTGKGAKKDEPQGARVIKEINSNGAVTYLD